MTDTNIELFPDLEKSFLKDVEALVAKGNISYMDAIIKWCEDRELEIEFAATLISKNLALKSKLQIEAEDLNFLKKSVRIPI